MLDTTEPTQNLIKPYKRDWQKRCILSFQIQQKLWQPKEEECYDVDFEKLGQRTSEDDDDVKLPGMVTSRVSGIVPDQQGSGSETGKKKVWSLSSAEVIRCKM